MRRRRGKASRLGSRGAAGYRVVEINASDDRSAKTLSELVGNAMGNASVADGAKPVMVVLDEVDGVDGDGVAEFLVQMLVHDKPRVTRPLVAICNDLYAPALRPLRTHAHVLRMDAVRLERLMGRLRHICRAEGISRQVDDDVLLYLCQMTNNDARSAINTLQFVAKAASLRRGVPITRDTLVRLNMTAAHVANSATHYNFFAALSQTLTMSARSPADGSRASAADALPHLEAVWRHVADNNHDHALTDALFTNYLTLPMGDADLRRTLALAEWFAMYDLALGEMQRHQHFELTALLPALGVAANHWCGLATGGPARVLRDLSFPREDAQCARRQQQMLETCREWLAGVPARDGLPPHLGLDLHALLQQRLPFQLRILDPLQPSHATTISRNVDPARRDALLARLAAGHLAHGLDYVLNHDAPPRAKPGAPPPPPPLRYRLDPPLDALVLGWDGPPPPPALPVRDCDAVLHTLFLKMRPAVDEPKPSSTTGAGASAAIPRAAATAAPTVNPVLRDFFGRAVVVAAAPPCEDDGRATLGRQREALRAQAAQGRDVRAQLAALEQRMSELDRLQAHAARTATAAAAAPAPAAKAHLVRFKYNAGATQAVKRTCYVRDFL